MNELNRLKEKLQEELNDYFIIDTYTKGKRAGLRKAIVMIEDMLSEHQDKSG